MAGAAHPGTLDLWLRVDAATTEADRVVSLVLSDADGRELPEWMPGAHLDLAFDVPGASEPVVRQFSLCGDRHDRTRFTIAVLLEPQGRGGSRAAHELRVGETVCVVGLRNHFPLELSHHHVFIAGGIGITPLLPMIAEADDSGTPWELHYAGRSLPAMAFARELAERHGSRVHLYPKAEGTALDVSAIVGRAASTSPVVPAAAVPAITVYACGPERLLDATSTACSDAGLPLHLERFVAAQEALDAASEASAGDQPFDVLLAQTGVTITVEPGQSILDVAERAGADVFGSCLEGICGTCETRVLAGEPIHRDQVLNGADTGTMMICVSRSAGKLLTLDA